MKQSGIIIGSVIVIALFLTSVILFFPISTTPVDIKLSNGTVIHAELSNHIYPSESTMGYLTEDHLKRNMYDYVGSFVFLRQLHEVYNVLDKQNLSNQEFFDTCIYMVQNMEYEEYPIAGDVRSIYTILQENKSDCDERVYLAGGLLKLRGFEVAMTLLTPKDKTKDSYHALLAMNTTAGITYIELSTPEMKTYHFDMDFWGLDEFEKGENIPFPDIGYPKSTLLPQMLNVTGKESFLYDGKEYFITLYRPII